MAGKHDLVLKRIERLLETMPTPDPPEGWEDRVLEAIEAELQRNRLDELRALHDRGCPVQSNECAIRRMCTNACGQAQSPRPCRHDRTEKGRPVPRRWGNWATEVCSECGAFRTHANDRERSRMSPWRPAAEYAAAVSDDD